MGDATAPEPGTDPAPEPKAPATPEPKGTERLPDDHPLVTAYQRVKQEAAEARQRVQEFEDAKKTDGEKLADRITAAEERATKAEQKALRLEIAAAKGLTPAQAKRLVGTTKEELEADADEILDAFPAKGTTPPPGRKPSPDMGGGTDPTNQPVDVKKLVDSIPPTA